MTNTTHPKSLITLTVMLVTVLEVLDMTIVNVALPPMMGSLAANSEEITWILTSYIVSAAIFMPLTGILIDRFGQKRLLIANIIGFCISSMLCGLASSLFEMILFRTLQGVFGASLVPLSQFILRNTYSKEEQGKAMAIWGMGVMVAPVLGPTLGGYITETMNWRWVFYINAPVCLLALFMSMRYICDTSTKHIELDKIGLCLITLCIGSLQLFLDQGNSKDWLNSDLIKSFLAITIIAGALFVYRATRVKNNIIDLDLFKDFNFSLSCILILGFMISLFGVMSTQPMMLENLMNYPTEDAGLLMAPRGLASAITMAFVSKIIGKVNPKSIILTGLICAFASCQLMAGFQLQTSANTMVWVGVIQGVGMGLFFVPVSLIALATLSPNQAGEASGLFSLSRSIGSSCGISLISMLVTRETQINWHSLGSYITKQNASLQIALQKQGLDLLHPAVAKLLENKVALQANFNSFIDGFLLSSYGFLILIPLVFLLKTPDSPAGEQVSLNH